MGVTLGSLWDQVWVSLGSVWVSVGDFGSLDGHFAIIVDSLWVYEGPLSKNIHFPTYFNDFIKFMGELCITLGHFGVTLGV